MSDVKIPKKMGLNTGLGGPKHRNKTSYVKGDPRCGRPTGSRSKVTLALEEIGAENAEAAFRMMVKAALGQLPHDSTFDVFAAKLIIDRVWPLRKGARFKVAIPIVRTAQELNDAFNDIFGMLREGEISLEEAKMACDILEGKSKVTDVASIEKTMLELKAEMEEWKIKNG